MQKSILSIYALLAISMPVYASQNCDTDLEPSDDYNSLSEILKCLNNRINELATLSASQSNDVSDLRKQHIPAMAKSLQHYTENLDERASKGVNGSNSKAKALVEDYNDLVRQLQAIPEFSSHPFITSLEMFESLQDANQAASAIADLAKGINAYLGDVGDASAFRVSFAELAKNAGRGINGSNSKARVLKEEYNLLIRQTKKVMKRNSFVASQEEIESIHDANETAGTISRSAESIAMMLSSL